MFLELTQALEEQGLGRKVVADMLMESGSTGGVSLWEAVHRYIAEKDVVTRAELQRRFARDDAESLAGILHDLVESGLVYKTGRAEHVVYRIAPEADLQQALERDQRATVEACAWAIIYRQGPLAIDALLELMPVERKDLDIALEALLEDNRVERDDQGRYRSARVLLPIEHTAGWEAGLLDHNHAVVGAIIAKLRNGQTRALPADELGGSTYTFDVWPGHPLEGSVRALLREQSSTLGALRDRVVEHNKQGKPASYTRGTFYCGQWVAEDGTLDSHGTNTDQT